MTSILSDLNSSLQIKQKQEVRYSKNNPGYNRILDTILQKAKTYKENKMIYDFLTHFPKVRDFLTSCGEDEEQSEILASRLCNNMRLEQYQQGDVVISQGDESNEKFYIIIKGRCGVFINFNMSTSSGSSTSRSPLRRDKSQSSVEQLNTDDYKKEDSIIQEQNKTPKKSIQKKAFLLGLYALKSGKLQQQTKLLDRDGLAEVNTSFYKMDKIKQHNQSQQNTIAPQVQNINDDPLDKNFERVNAKNPGDYFGEKALQVEDQKLARRNATIVCESDCDILILSKKDFQYVQQSFTKQNIFKSSFLLNNLPPLQQINNQKIRQEKIGEFEEVSVQTTERIINEGDIKDDIYLLIDGKLKIEKKILNENNIYYTQYVYIQVCQLDQPSFIGEEILINDKKPQYQYSVSATSYSRLYKIKKTILKKKFNKDDNDKCNPVSNEFNKLQNQQLFDQMKCTQQIDKSVKHNLLHLKQKLQVDQNQVNKNKVYEFIDDNRFKIAKEQEERNLKKILLMHNFQYFKDYIDPNKNHQQQQQQQQQQVQPNEQNSDRQIKIQNKNKQKGDKKQQKQQEIIDKANKMRTLYSNLKYRKIQIQDVAIEDITMDQNFIKNLEQIQKETKQSRRNRKTSQDSIDQEQEQGKQIQNVSKNSSLDSKLNTTNSTSHNNNQQENNNEYKFHDVKSKKFLESLPCDQMYSSKIYDPKPIEEIQADSDGKFKREIGLGLGQSDKISKKNYFKLIQSGFVKPTFKNKSTNQNLRINKLRSIKKQNNSDQKLFANKINESDNFYQQSHQKKSKYDSQQQLIISSYYIGQGSNNKMIQSNNNLSYNQQVVNRQNKSSTIHIQNQSQNNIESEQNNQSNIEEQNYNMAQQLNTPRIKNLSCANIAQQHFKIPSSAQTQRSNQQKKYVSYNSPVNNYIEDFETFDSYKHENIIRQKMQTEVKQEKTSVISYSNRKLKNYQLLKKQQDDKEINKFEQQPSQEIQNLKTQESSNPSPRSNNMNDSFLNNKNNNINGLQSVNTLYTQRDFSIEYDNQKRPQTSSIKNNYTDSIKEIFQKQKNLKIPNNLNFQNSQLIKTMNLKQRLSPKKSKVQTNQQQSQKDLQQQNRQTYKQIQRIHSARQIQPHYNFTLQKQQRQGYIYKPYCMTNKNSETVYYKKQLMDSQQQKEYLNMYNSK